MYLKKYLNERLDYFYIVVVMEILFLMQIVYFYLFPICSWLISSFIADPNWKTTGLKQDDLFQLKSPFTLLFFQLKEVLSCLDDPHTGGTAMLGFEPLVNQRLLPPTFPRYTHIKSRPEAYQYLEDLISRLKQACRVSACTSFHSALVSAF